MERMMLLYCAFQWDGHPLESTPSIGRSGPHLLLLLGPTLVCCQTGSRSHTHTHTHPFNGPFSRTTRVGQYQKGTANLDFTEARDSEWQWHQLGICKSAPRSRQITMPAPHHSVYYRPDALPAAQPTASKHWRHDQLSHFCTMHRYASAHIDNTALCHL